MSQNHISSFSISHMLSHDDFDKPHNQIVNLNCYTLQVRKPDDQNILQFLNSDKIELATFSKKQQDEALPQIDPPSSLDDQQQEKIALSQSPVLNPSLSPSIENILIDEAILPENNYCFDPDPEPVSQMDKFRRNQIAASLNQKNLSMTIVKNFVKIIKLLSPFKPQSLLTSSQELIINDYSSSTVNKRSSINNLQKSGNKKENYFIKLLFQSTISPLSYQVFLWESIKIIFTIYLLFQFTIQICFNQPITLYLFSPNRSFQILVLLFFICDMIVKAKTDFYKEGLLINNCAKIAHHYWKEQFVFDLISLIPILLNVISKESLLLRVLNFLLFIKLNELRVSISSLEERIYLSPTFLIGYKLFRVISIIFVFAHIFGCLWHAIGTINPERSWISFMRLEQEDWYILYSYSIYWSFTQMSTMGFGDLIVQNEYEILFSILTMLFALLVFGYTMNTIGQILQQISKTQRQTDEDLQVINCYMKRKNLHPKLQYRVRKYLQNRWIEQRELRFEDESKIIQQLSSELQQEIQVNLYREFLQKVPLFEKYFSVNLITELIKQIEEYRVQKNSYITETGSTDGAGLYCLLSGEVNIGLELNDNNYQIGKKRVIIDQQIFEQGDIFGQTTFFYSRPQPYTVKTKSICSIAFLSKQNFLETLKRFPNDYQMYCMISNQVVQKQKKIDIRANCFGCQSNDHDIDECPLLHFVLNPRLVVQKFLYSKNQSREPRKRGDRRSTNAKFGQKLIDDVANLFQDNNNLQIEFREKTEQTNDNGDNLNVIQQKGGTSLRSQTHTSSKKSTLRIRKKSHSLNSISIQNSESNQVEMSSHSGNESLHHQQSNLEQQQRNKYIIRLSAIPQIKASTNQQSVLSQSSIQIFLKENLRKPSYYQNSDNSNTSPFIQQWHKSSSQSKSKENSGTNNSNNNNLFVPSSLGQEENKQFQRNDDISPFSSQHQRKSLIGLQQKPLIKSSQSQTFNRILERNEQKRNREDFGSILSIKSNTQKSDQKKSKVVGSAFKQQSSYKSHVAFQELQQLDQSNQDTNKKGQQSSRFTGETAKQFVNAPQLPSFEDRFEIPSNLHSFYPTDNLQNILQKYNKYQVKRQSQQKRYYSLLAQFIRNLQQDNKQLKILTAQI